MIKAIDTVYNGLKFRSRMEARWAVFFDKIGLKYEYEKEGYDIDGVWYLPDFWIPSLDMWFEVKGRDLLPEERALYENFVIRSEKAFGILYNIPSEHSIMYGGSTEGLPEIYFTLLDGNGKKHCGYDIPYMFCECMYCGAIGFQFDGRSERINCCKENNGHKDFNGHSTRLLDVYDAARQARFEHGEKP